MRRLLLALLMIVVAVLVVGAVAFAARPTTGITLTASGPEATPACRLTSTVSLAPQHARGLVGGRVDFRHYATGGSYSHSLMFTSPVAVTKRTKTIVFSPATGFSGGFSWEVDAVGFDRQSNQLFTVSSALVPIPTGCP